MANPEIRTQVEDPFEEKRAPKLSNKARDGFKAPEKVAKKLEEFGVKWDGKLTLSVNGEQASVALADTTKRVSFASGETFAEIVGYDENGTKTTLLVLKAEIKMNGDEVEFPSAPGESETFGKILERKASVYASQIQNTGAQIVTQPNFPNSKI